MRLQTICMYWLFRMLNMASSNSLWYWGIFCGPPLKVEVDRVSRCCGTVNSGLTSCFLVCQLGDAVALSKAA